jgi:hypothetical protein
MSQPRKVHGPCQAQIIDFDEALLDACPAPQRNEVMREAELLAQAFAPGADAERLRRMADQLSTGQRDAEMGRAHARRLAAALKRLAKAA